jgi:hypothetical protein
MVIMRKIILFCCIAFVTSVKAQLSNTAFSITPNYQRWTTVNDGYRQQIGGIYLQRFGKHWMAEVGYSAVTTDQKTIFSNEQTFGVRYFLKPDQHIKYFAYFNRTWGKENIFIVSPFFSDTTKRPTTIKNVAWRVGMGAIYMINPNIGLDVKWGYGRTLQNFEIINTFGSDFFHLFEGNEMDFYIRLLPFFQRFSSDIEYPEKLVEKGRIAIAAEAKGARLNSYFKADVNYFVAKSLAVGANIFYNTFRFQNTIKPYLSYNYLVGLRGIVQPKMAYSFRRTPELSHFILSLGLGRFIGKETLAMVRYNYSKTPIQVFKSPIIEVQLEYFLK